LVGRALPGRIRADAVEATGTARFTQSAKRAVAANTSAPLRAGFTLVEVIVVLVILAILAAIAIPALTGYIDKAQDKQYIAEHRT
jgi:prepilin-type N-terminal cleavage/methylation domain-containing protein